MANKKQAVEVKQEGDFKIKSKPKKPKQLAIADEEIAKIKIDNRKPEAQGEVIPDVAKIDLTKNPEEDAVQTHKTDDSNVVVEESKDSSDSKAVANRS